MPVNAESAALQPGPPAAWFAEDETVRALDFGLAVTFADFEGALRLLHDQYVWRGYMAPDPSGRRLSLHNALPTTKLIVAKAEGRVVGLLTVFEDSRLGLPMDDAFGEELGRLRERGRRLAEVSSLAVDPGHRSSGIAISVRLLRLAVLYAARIARVDELCFVLNPRHREFYERLFPFRWFREPRPYRRIQGQPPALGVRLDLALVRALLRAERAGLSPGPHSHFLCGPEASGLVMARLRRDLPRSSLTPPEWARLFADAGPQHPEGADRSTFQLGAFLGAVHSEAGGRSS
jgi:GNAT superfamily N-acetyltransferase